MKRGWLVLLMITLVPGASAEIQGDCDVVIFGEDLRTRDSEDPKDAIEVRLGDNVTYTVTAMRDIRSFQLIAEVGPYEVVLDDQNFTRERQARVIEGNTTFEGLPGGAAGVFRYRGEVTYWGGGDCNGAVLIQIIPTSPFTPVLLGATLVAGAGLTGLIVAIIRGYQDSKEIFDVVKDYVDEARQTAKK